MKLWSTTLLSHSLPSLLQKFRSLGFSKDSTTIAAISAPVEHCQTLVDAFKLEYPVHLGCISAPLLDPRYDNKPFTYNMSLLAIPPTVRHVPFTSTVPGLGPVAVGRLHRPERATRVKPPEAPALSEEVVRPCSEPSTILYFSDDAPEGLQGLLSNHLPHTPKLGMISASTPFFNGRPFSLIYNGKWHSTGAVGVRIYTRTMDMKYAIPSGFKPMALPLTVTESQGNMVYTLNGLNSLPEVLRILETEYKTASEFTRGEIEDRVFIALVDPSTGESRRLWAISGGKGSRGLVLGGDSGPPTGSLIQLFLKDPQLPYDPAPVVGPTKTTTIRFLTSATDLSAFTDREGKCFGLPLDEGVLELRNTFVVASENGFLVDEGGTNSRLTPWRCGVAGMFASGEL